MKLDLIEKLIREAKGVEARKLLNELAKGKIAENERLRFAALARRAYLPDLAIKILYPKFRLDSRIKQNPSVFEKTEYGACLIRIGAYCEAKKILESVEAEKCKEAWFFLAGLEIRVWNYQAAIPLLKKYCSQPDVDPYLKKAAKINLAISLFYEKKYWQAKSLLSESLEETQDKAHSLLHANALRQLGILEFNRAHWEESKLYFLQAKEVLKDSVGLDSFLCDKWVGIVDYKIHAGSRGTRERLKSLRKEGGEWKHWESVRDIDFRLAVEEKDVRLLTHLYFGTFNERFKERVLEALGMEHLPREYKWKLGKGKEPVVVVDPFEMQGDGFKTGQATFRLLDALTSDFYRPIPIVELFERVFIGSSYSPTTSAARVNQVILRLRKIFKKKRIPLTIQIKDAEARLVAKKPVHLVVRNYGKTLDSVATRLELIREKCSEAFTSRDAAKILELSPRGTRVWLQAALNENLIERQRIGRDFQYSIIKPAIKLAA